MADYDSDSSGVDDIETNVLLGYAAKEPTGDDFSQLGGHPTWLDNETPPSGVLAKCKVCNGLMNLLLQINGDLPDRFPGHERRLYIWSCKRKACRRKDGSVRGFRATRQSQIASDATGEGARRQNTQPDTITTTKPAMNLGETLFGVKPITSANTNPFSTTSSNGGQTNPFAAPGSSANPFSTTSSLAAKPPQKPDTTVESLPQTFAEKARISSPEPAPGQKASTPFEPWPKSSAFPQPYPRYHLDADKEYIDSSPSDPMPSSARVDTGEGSSSSGLDKEAFESSMDKTFQKFADRLSQNPEQVLRYEFAGQPLLYSKTDAVGKLLAPSQENDNAKVKTVGGSGGSKIPRCGNCGSERVFELQLTPHLISELEAEDLSVDGMDWGTIILGVCSKDCQEKDKQEGMVGYVEEWTGVQWEEMASRR